VELSSSATVLTSRRGGLVEVVAERREGEVEKQAGGNQHGGNQQAVAIAPVEHGQSKRDRQAWQPAADGRWREQALELLAGDRVLAHDL
jgi:hypothetical protein